MNSKTHARFNTAVASNGCLSLGAGGAWLAAGDSAGGLVDPVERFAFHGNTFGRIRLPEPDPQVPFHGRVQRRDHRRVSLPSGMWEVGSTPPATRTIRQ